MYLGPEGRSFADDPGPRDILRLAPRGPVADVADNPQAAGNMTA
ncbi:hypothetical protein PC116_g13118 [Phytophthora cactorum]|nr:hypothetical protein PC116_g13118 [Phytophthora cactorum]